MKNYLRTFAYSAHSKCTCRQFHNSVTVCTRKTISGETTFYCKASVLWNKLPPTLRVNLGLSKVNEFKNAITRK